MCMTPFSTWFLNNHNKIGMKDTHSTTQTNPQIITVWFRALPTDACIIGASVSEPHTCQTVSPTICISIYVCLVRHSINKCPRVLIHWTAAILQCVIKACPTMSYILLVIQVIINDRSSSSQCKGVC